MMSMLIKALKNIRRLFLPQAIIIKKLSGETFIVDKRCKVCMHPQRAEIEKKLIDGANYEEIAKQYDLSIASISRHLRKHMPRLVLEPEKLQELYQERRVKQIDLQEEMFRLIDRLNNLFAKLEKLDALFESGKVKAHAYVESVSERRNILQQIRETLLIIQELRGEIKTEKDISELLQKLKNLS
jgi:DNA-binding transcriptional ArsR family regulator